MANKAIEKVQKTGQDLYEIRKEIQRLDEEYDKAVGPLKAERDVIEGVLISEMNNIGLKSIKNKTGDTLTVATKKSLAITSEPFALKWAIENKAVSINKTLVTQLLKGKTETPEGFERVDREYISVKKAPTE